MTFIFNNKQLKIKLLTSFIFIISSHTVFAQILDGGQNPPSVKFRQINTPKFQIIYPTPFENEAQRMANTLDAIVDDVSKSLGRAPRPISIILQSQGVVSNGFVTMAPRHSEFYTIPAQEFDSQDWLNSLAVHELRHVVQFDKIAPHFGAPLFEELKLALFGVNLPAWFFEGDAVLTETLLTEAGRGRQPGFDLVLRTNLLSGKNYSYSKNYFGSFKNFTPGYYPLGYFMTTKIRRDNQPMILDKVLERIKNFPTRPYNFSSSIKKFTGVNTNQLHQKTMDEMTGLWNQQIDKNTPRSYEILNEVNLKNPSNYLLPFRVSETEILCLKNSLARPSEIIMIDEKKREKVILKIGYQTEPNLSYSSGKIVWDEYRTDLRFEQRNFNVICTYNLATKKYQQLTHKSRFFSPSLSADGEKIIAVEVSTENKFNLVELDAETGEILKTFPNPENFVLQTPAYHKNGKDIVVTAVNQKGKTLLLYHNGIIEQLLPQSNQMIARPTFDDDKIIYKAHYTGIENIYQLNTATKEIKPLSSVYFGAHYPSINNYQLLFSDYTLNGYNVVKHNLSSSEQIITNKQTNTFVNYFEPLISQENKSNVFDSIPNHRYESKKYASAKNLFYFHSLRPNSSTNQFTNSSDFGFDLISNNMLNTLASSIGYNYNNALKKSEYKLSFNFNQYYPKIALDYQNRAIQAYVNLGTAAAPNIVAFNWRENYTALGMEIPFNANWLNKNFYSNVSINTYYTNRYQISFKPNNFYTSIQFPASYEFVTGLNTRRSPRDLAPKWGQNISLTYQHFPLDKRLDGENLYFQSVFYFPGILTNHSFRASINYQKNNGLYQYSTDINRASGWANLEGIVNLKNTFLFSYRFPIMYPDLEVGPLAYIKRIKGGLFTDFENIGEGSGLRSYGLELKADMNLLRYYLPNFEFGSKFIIPHKSIVKKTILEFSLNYNY